MKRLPGVIISAIILVLISLLQLVMAVGMGFAGAVVGSKTFSDAQHGAATGMPTPGWMHIVMYGMCAFIAALAVWGIWTAVGLFRTRRWARYSVLVIGGGLAVIGLISMLMTLVTMAVSLPATATMSPAQVESMHAMTKVIFGIVALFYGIMCAVGISWLIYFNLKKVRDAFASGPGWVVESRRPVLIAVISVLTMIGACSCVLTAFLTIPTPIFGFLLHGWEKAAFFLIYGVLLAAAGVGLWRLEEWARRLAMAIQALGLVQYVIYVAHPSLMTRYSAEINQTMGLGQQQPPAQFQNSIYIVSFGMGILFLIATMWILHYYRGAFARPGEP